MGEQTKNMMIGLFVLVACATIVWLILFLKPTVGDGKETLYVRFANINQINIGTRVTFAGKPVGEVVAIESVPDARQKPLSDVLGEIYYYQLILKVDSSVRVYDTDEITVQTSGLLGEKSIAIIPKVPPKGTIPKLISNKQPIYAQSVDPIEKAVNELSSLSKEMKQTFQLTSSWIQKNGNDLGNAIRSVGNTMDEVKVTVAKINADKIVDDIKQSIVQFTSTLQDVQNAVQEMQVGHVFTNIGIVMDRLKGASTNFETISQNIVDGKGTLGQLISKDDFYLHLNAILSKVDTLMNDVNHYGILFHLNKGWQRQRAKQITTLNALNTPSNFRKYFQEEVSSINTAMSRLSMLIEKAERNPKKEEIMQNEAFKKDFKDLMDQADSLSNNLKLYNEQLNDSSSE